MNDFVLIDLAKRLFVLNYRFSETTLLFYNSGSEEIDITFLMHFSNTMRRPDHQRVLEFLKSSLQYADLDNGKVKVGGVVFRKMGVPLFDFNTYPTKEQLFSAIEQISYNYRY